MLRPSKNRCPFLAVASVLAIVGVVIYVIDLAYDLREFVEEW